MRLDNFVNCYNRHLIITCTVAIYGVDMYTVVEVHNFLFIICDNTLNLNPYSCTYWIMFITCTFCCLLQQLLVESMTYFVHANSS